MSKGKSIVPFESCEVIDWPEFAALASRLGIDLRQRTALLQLTMKEGEPLRVVHEYWAAPEEGKPS